MTELKKEITLWRGLVLAISIVIGSGLLSLPGLTLEAGDIYSSAMGWMLICVAAIPLIYIFTRLGMKYTSSAGLAQYAEVAVGEWGGYIVTIILFGTLSLGIPVVASIGASYIRDLFDFQQSFVSLTAFVILIFVTSVNILGVKFSALLNTASFVCLILMLLSIIFFNLSFFSSGLSVFAESIVLTGEGKLSYSEIWTTSALLFWAFLGWENLSFGFGEFKNPKETIQKVSWGSYAIVAALYLGLAVTSIGADASGLSIKGASGLTELLKMTPFGSLLIIIVILVILANINSWMFSFSRLVYSAGLSGMLPSFIGKLNKKSIPFNSLLTIFVICSCIILIERFLSLSTLIMLVNQNFIVLYIISVFAFWKTEKGIRRWAGSLPALASCGFLLSGFTWWSVYPFFLIITGYVVYRIKAVKK